MAIVIVQAKMVLFDLKTHFKEIFLGPTRCPFQRPLLVGLIEVRELQLTDWKQGILLNFILVFSIIVSVIEPISSEYFLAIIYYVCDYRRINTIYILPHPHKPGCYQEIRP